MKQALAGAALGALLGGSSVATAVWFGDTRHEDQMQRIEATWPVPVLVARRTLHPGLPIGRDDLIELHWSPATLKDRPVAYDATSVVGRIPRVPILQGEAIRPERLASKRGDRGLNALIPRGMRALTFKARTVPGLLLNSEVKVMLNTNEQLVGKLLRNDGRVVTLVLSPRHAERVASVLSAGGVASITQ